MKRISDVIFDYLDEINIESSQDFGELNKGFRVDSYSIESVEDSKQYNKPIGDYKLLSVEDVLMMNREDIEYTIDIVYKILRQLIGKVTSNDRFLIVGLGNRHISSDSLGAKVVGGINISIEDNRLPKVMAIAPSVLGLTGIESYDIISGVVNKIKPTHIILIDSLCASSVDRLGKSIQMTNTGLCPGSGIGNRRKCIDSSIGCKVYSIGIPLLIYASTFVYSAFERFDLDNESISSVMQVAEKSCNNSKICDFIKSIDKVLNTEFDNCIVSIKDIEECVKILSQIVSNAINRVLRVESLSE